MAIMRPLADIREQMDRVFQEMETFHLPRLENFMPLHNAMTKTWFPAVDLAEANGNYLVKVEVPGIKPENLHIEVLDHTIVIFGETETEKEESKKDIYRKECSYGSLYRRIPLPGNVKRENVKAELKHGLLKLTLPRIEEEKGTPVAIQVK